MYRLRSDARAMGAIGRSVATSIDEARELLDRMGTSWNEGNAIAWAITLKDDDDRLIGTIGFHRLMKEHFRAEIGYMLHPDHWRKGIMGEALEAVVDHGFSRMGLHSIEANTDPRNTPSNSLLKKHGFKQEGLLKENFYRNGEFLDTAIWSRINDRATDAGSQE